MRPGLAPHLLALISQQSAALDGGVAWTLSPDDPFLAAFQAERRASADAGMAQAGAGLDRDIAALREGWRPRPDGLTQAPTMVADNVTIILTPDLIGLQLRGPVLDTQGRQVSEDRITSLVVAVDIAQGRWARTLNRFYRLAHEPQTEGDEL